ncbi:MAG: nucleotidyl transferase AbiEii/AbiGii toxin family protein [Bacteroidia bacterium]|jgi:predicted nucleotidyltransferase component of viral defense system|nr:nucleotidyl transferase AbiEii/AbiGii toxin family protein [Bacteroidia bacterium]
MIPRAYITEWSDHVPWQTNEQVEQDLVICRALVELFSDEFLYDSLAFRGGTALHKLFLKPQPRYSEDIDLVQLKPEPIKATVQRIQKQLAFIGKSSVEQKANNTTLKFRFESEFPPVQTLRLKVETNCREHFTVYGHNEIPFSVESSWFNGACKIKTYSIEELLGTKLRALYQRRKGRDLFDLYRAITHHPALDTDKIIECYNVYMKHSVAIPPTGKMVLKNIEQKMQDDEFLGDTRALLRPEENYNPAIAFELVRDKLLIKLMKG